MKLNVKNIDNGANNTNNKWHTNKYMDIYLKKIFENKDAYDSMMNPCKEHDAGLLPDIDEASEFLLNNRDMSVCIFGDYDGDGILSTSILYNGLKQFFHSVNYMIPNREKDGYGMNTNMLKKAFEGRDPSKMIVITCDNGISCHEAINYAKEQGATVILTDHHTPDKNNLPNADYIIHPQLGNYPFGEISGATVTYKFMNYLFDKAGYVNEELSRYILQMATISIVTDVMPVASSTKEEMDLNENRGLLIKGLKSINENPDWHMNMLMDFMKIAPGTMDETSIGFSVGPTLNASGRIFDATIAVDFFAYEEQDKEFANTSASFLMYLNEKRKEMKNNELQLAKEVVCGNNCRLAFAEGLSKGLIGIVAGNFCQENHLPSGVFTLGVMNGEAVWTGSMRSDTINVYDALTWVNEKLPLVAFGGHSGAAGVSVKDSDKDKFIELFEEYATQNACEPLDISIQLDKFEDYKDFGEALKNIKPLGQGLPRPTVKFKFYCDNVNIFYKSGHVKLGNYTQAELWLYGQKDAILKHPVLDVLPLSKSNVQAKIDEGMTPEEAEANKYERYSKFKSYYLFDIVAEVDYSTFMNITGPQLSVRSYD